MQPKKIILEDAPKHYRHDQDKFISPDETVRRFHQRLRETGLDLLERVVRIDNGRLGIPVYFSICGPDASTMTGTYKQMGKGATPEQAQASAVMELAERYSLFSFYHNSANFITSTANALPAPCLDFNWIAKSVGEQDEDPSLLRDLFNQVPMQWTWAYNLTREESVLIPFNWFFNINEFNGASAGNCNSEAICQGICEVVERHASALVSGSGATAPRIDPRTIDDPVAKQLIDKYRAAGVELFINDLTADMGIASVGVLAWDPATFPEKSEIVWTAGTMPDPSKALCRTLTEVAQLAGDFNSGGNYLASGLPKFRSIGEAAGIANPSQTKSLSSLPDLSDNNIKTEVMRCLQALSQRQMDVFVVDVRHPVLDIAAFYSMVPGTLFRERAASSNVAMLCAKIATQMLPPDQAMIKLNTFDKALPDRYFFKFYKGQLLLEDEDYDGAVEHFEQALRLQPPDEDKASIFTYLGLVLKNQGRYGEALEVLEKANAIDGERTDTLNLMGFCHFKRKAHEEAVACFGKLVALDPSSAIDYANLAVNYRALGQQEKAVEFYQLALSLDADISFARQHLAEMGIET